MAEVRMPKMGDGMEEGTINAWLKKEGDTVHSGDVIAEVETDKANVEISAYETGVLSKIVVQEGETVPVGAVIAMIGDSGAPTAVGNGALAEPAVSSEAMSASQSESVSTASESAVGPGLERVKASPLARRMARELGIDLARVRGTGPGGAIRQRDIQAYRSQSPTEKPRPAAPKVEPPPTPVAPPPSLRAEEFKPSKMREAIARRTLQSKQNIPHFYETMIIEMDRAQALLKELNADAPDSKITVNDIIVKACAVALGRVPEVNATWTPEGTVRRYAEAHIGIAVGMDEGLIIPVVRNCETKTLRQISAEAKTLIGKARAGQLKPEEYSGGTFSVSNLGMMGVDEFIAIINPPEAAILAIGTITREPVVLPDSDQIAIRSRMKVTLSADHRLLDGVLAARFLQEVKKALEAPFALVG